MPRVYPRRTTYPLRVDPTVFTPKKVPNLALWLKGDAGITLNGSNVSAWANQGYSGTKHNTAQGTAGNQPARGTAALNGILGVTFTTNKYLSIDPSTITLLNGKPGVTMFAVIKSSTGVQQNIFGIAQGNAGSDSLRAGLSITSGNQIQFSGSRADSVSFPSGVSGGTHTTAAEIIHATWDLATRTVFVYLNGVQVATSTTYSTAGSTFAATNPSSSEVGDYIFYHSDPLAGDLFELLVYEQALTTAQQTSIKNYLSGKYAITVS